MQPSIQFTEQASPSAKNPSSSEDGIGGVVRLRSRSQTRGYKRSVDPTKPGEQRDAEDEDAGLRNEADYKRSQVNAAQANSVHCCSQANQVSSLLALVKSLRSHTNPSV